MATRDGIKSIIERLSTNLSVCTVRFLADLCSIILTQGIRLMVGYPYPDGWSPLLTSDAGR